MKRWTIAVIASLIVMIGAVYVTTKAQAAPKKTMLMGEVIDITTYAMKGIRGEQMTKEGTFRVENGFPACLLCSLMGLRRLGAKPGVAAACATGGGIPAPFVLPPGAIEATRIRAIRGRSVPAANCLLSGEGQAVSLQR